jgi:hypothetical protein
VAGFDPDTVGEGAAGVDGDAEGLWTAAHGTQKSNTGGGARAGAPTSHRAGYPDFVTTRIFFWLERVRFG